MDGIFLLDKPRGPTSHDCVDAVRRVARLRRVGHAGTLDPMATGLLVVLVGPATSRARELAGHDKAYRATLRLGARTDTGDAEGKILEERPVPPLAEEAVRAALGTFAGERMQRPPAYSAVKVGGRPAYWYARRGRPVPLPERRIRIGRIALLRLEPRELEVEVECSAGTFVRSLAESVAEALGTCAHLAALRRLRSGPYRVEDAAGLAALAGLGPEGLSARLLPAGAPPARGPDAENP